MDADAKKKLRERARLGLESDPLYQAAKRAAAAPCVPRIVITGHDEWTVKASGEFAAWAAEEYPAFYAAMMRAMVRCLADGLRLTPELIGEEMSDRPHLIPREPDR